MKKSIAAALSVLAGLALTGCSFQDFMLYLYGGDGFVKTRSRTMPAVTVTTV